MSLAIILLNWNQAEDTAVCARTLLAWPASLPRQIWVVDNGSQASDLKTLRQLEPDVHLITSQTNRGFAGGNNLGIQAALDAGCEQILLLNNDAAIDIQNLQRLQQALQNEERLGVVGPTLWDSDNPERLLSAGGDDIGTVVSAHYTMPPQPGEIRPVAYVPGACVLIRRQVFEAVGLLDEAYFFGGEVADLCARARQQGVESAIVGGARACHAVDRSAAIRHRLHIYYVLRNRFLFVRKFHADRRRPLFWQWTRHSLRPWLQALLTADWPRERAIRLAVWDGWRGRFGAQNGRVTKGEIA